MEHDKPILRGNLLVPPAGKLMLKKSWHQKYCQLFKASKFGLGRLEIYENDIDSVRVSPQRIITLEDCIKIIPRSPTFFAVTTKTSQYEFGTASTDLMNEWLTCLQSVAFPDDVSKITIEEDNELYSPSGEGVYVVKLHPSPASTRCQLECKFYTLVLTSNALQLRDYSSGGLLFSWPYRLVRRYGCSDGKFSFEAGRLCESGEGTFYFEHPSQREIFRCFVTKLKTMKQMISTESHPATPTTPNTTILDCGENQLHAALSMEARSRSPLPPSPAASTTLRDIESNVSLKSQTSFPDQTSAKKPNPPKSKPTKPPRKSVPSKEMFGVGDPEGIYEAVDETSYDEIQYRDNAWKTLGIGEIRHTEALSEEPEEDYMSWGMKKNTNNNNNNNPKIQASKVITDISNSNAQQDGYDKLNFFGSFSKLNPPSYKRVNLAASAEYLSSPPSFNDYDEVQPLECARQADDSHLGYGSIRKDAANSRGNVAANQNVDHQFENNEPYAVISKSKRDK